MVQDNEFVMNKVSYLNYDQLTYFHQSQEEKIMPTTKGKYKICQEELKSTDVIVWEKGPLSWRALLKEPWCLYGNQPSSPAAAHLGQSVADY